MGIDLNILKPDYYDTFSCTGSNCRNNCCNFKWDISLDKQTYKKYQTITNPEMKEKVRKFIKRNKNSTSSLQYAYIQQTTDPVACTFQTEEGLCYIHATMGPDYLCNTCMQYPRIINLNKDILERGLSSSCEALTETLLKRTDPIQFVQDHLSGTQNQVQSQIKAISNNLNLVERPIKEHYFFIKTICIAILQNREYSFEDRLCQLVFYLKKINTLEKEENFSQIEPFTNQFVSLLQNEPFTTFDDLTPGIEQQFSLSLTMLGLFNKFEDDFIHETIKSYLPEPPEILEDMIQFTQENYDQYEKNLKVFYGYMEDKEHFLENLFVNEFHSNMLPFFSKYDIFQNSQYFCALYSLYRFVIAAQLGKKGTLTEVELIDLVAFLGKKMIHTPSLFENIFKLIQKNNMNTVGQMAILIKGK